MGFVNITKEDAIDKVKKYDQPLMISIIDYQNSIDYKVCKNFDTLLPIIETSKAILYDADQFVPHMQIWSVDQNMIDIKRKGVLHDVLLSPK